MSWFQGVDKSWYNADNIKQFNVDCSGSDHKVYADSYLISAIYQTQEEAQKDLDAFIGTLILNMKSPEYWISKATSSLPPQEASPSQ